MKLEDRLLAGTLVLPMLAGGILVSPMFVSCSHTSAGPINDAKLILTNDNSSFTLMKEYVARSGYSTLGKPKETKIIESGNVSLKDAYSRGYFSNGFLRGHGELVSKFGETLCFYTIYERTYDKKTYDIEYTDFYKLDITSASVLNDGETTIALKPLWNDAGYKNNRATKEYNVFLKSEIVRYITPEEKERINFKGVGNFIYLDAEYDDSKEAHECYYNGHVFGKSNSKAFKASLNEIPTIRYDLISTEEVTQREFVVDVPNIGRSIYTN